MAETKSAMDSSSSRRQKTDGDLLYPEIEPFASGMLPVSSIHTIYFEQCGKKGGIPIIFVHG